MRRALIVAALALAACDDAADDAPVDAATPDAAVADATAALSVSGHAFSFSATGGPIGGATVRVLEAPDLSATTADDGSFRFDGLPDGSQVTLYLDGDDRPPIQTGTHTLAGEDMERVTFQAPDFSLYNALAAIVQLDPDPGRCQIASTVTRRGNSLYDEIPGTHGEPEATVTIEPRPDDVDGPIYFDLVRYNAIFPSRMLTETTADGGVLFLNVPPGDYTLRAHKADTVFRDVHITCRAGFIVNASPPWGLQAVEGGVGPRTEPDWQ
ncbi:MAG: carboxypeptidase regulatory-like domain-containing protein [Myxococcales bacterium]|nr:carboxypeptidase regulatory-like domain-containing protein [Myxococcales bacterium]